MSASMSSATIREARAEDIPRLLELYQQLSESSQHPEPTTRNASGDHDAALAQMSADPNVQIVVLEQDGRVIGTLTTYIVPNLSHGGCPFAIVENVVVDASVRGGGHGRLLMDHAVARARAAGCYKVALTSNNKRAAAHAFYERIGFIWSHRGFTRYLDAAPTARGSSRGVR